MQVDVHVYHLLVHCNMIVWAFDVVIWYVTIRWYQWSSCIACLYWWNFTPSSQTSYAANMLAHGEYSYLSCYPWYVLPAILQWMYACRYNVCGVIWSGLMTLFRMLHSNMIMFQYASTPFVLYNVVTRTWKLLWFGRECCSVYTCVHTGTSQVKSIMLLLITTKAIECEHVDCPLL